MTAGYVLTALAWLLALAAAGAGAAGAVRPSVRYLRAARWAALALFAVTTAAVALLLFALLTDRFDLVYVAANSERLMEPYFKISALWSGQAGSLLFWLWLLSGYLALIARRRPLAVWSLWPWAVTVLSAVIVFWATLVLFVENPFKALTVPMADGNGMNPLLRHPGMLLHPFLIYLGYTGFTVPFAFGIAALLARRPDASWFQYTRRWTLTGWVFLTLGILAGAQWAYDVLGWGGYWGWDPVENSSLMPWLVATAFLHSAIVQEKRGLLRNWNIVLILMIYVLTIVGTLVTRSGIIASVHAFAQSPIGPWFVAYLGAVTAGSVYLLIDRWDLLKSDREIDSYLSKESSFLLNNLLLAGSTFTILWGTAIPLITRFLGQEIVVGAPYFNRVNGPIFLVLIYLVGLGPLLAWRRTTASHLMRRTVIPVLMGIHTAVTVLVGFSGGGWGAALGAGGAVFVIGATFVEFYYALKVGVGRGEGFLTALYRLFARQPRRYGGYVVHIGLALLVIGIVGSHFYSEELDVGLTLGEQVTVAGYTIRYDGLGEQVDRGVPAVYADVSVSRDGEPVAVMRPAKKFYPRHVDTMGPISEVAVMGSLSRDLYVVLGGWEPDGGLAAFQINVNPAVAWIWLGGYVMVAGSILALAPETRPTFTAEQDQAIIELAALEEDYAEGRLDERTFRELQNDLMARAAAALRAGKDGGGGGHGE